MIEKEITQNIHDSNGSTQEAIFYDITAEDGYVLTFNGMPMGTHTITNDLQGWNEYKDDPEEE